MKPSFRLMRMAIKAHRTRAAQRKWLASVGYLQSRDRWIVGEPVPAERLREQAKQRA